VYFVIFSSSPFREIEKKLLTDELATRTCGPQSLAEKVRWRLCNLPGEIAMIPISSEYYGDDAPQKMGWFAMV
jgi:hypothetical protein